MQKLRDASPRIDIVKRFACLEGARLAFAKTMVHWPKIRTMNMATNPPPVGKENRHPELYFAAVMDGARAIEAQCSKDVIID